LSLTELNLVSIKNIQKGGSTMPLIIEAEDKYSNISFYVLKLYKKKYVNQNFSVAKEILVSEIAKEFDLPVPEYGIINFDHKLLLNFFNSDYIELLDTGYKFCSKLIDGVFIYNPNTKNKFLNSYDLENVFAFDNIIFNTDRGGFRNKPNLLVNDDNFVLIDHEQTFPFYSDSINSNINHWNNFSAYYYRNHVFYEQLKKIRNESYLFDEFQMSLNSFNLNIFGSIFAELDYFNIRNIGKLDIFNYFEWLKTNNNKVVKILNDRLL
jgi:hypothetical protein